MPRWLMYLGAHSYEVIVGTLFFVGVGAVIAIYFLCKNQKRKDD